MKKNYKFLNDINFPSDIKKLSHNELKTLAQEVREEMIDAVSETGGHLGAGLGVVELTVVLHYIFITPNPRNRIYNFRFTLKCRNNFVDHFT